MFPISWNNIFRKKDGALVTMDEAMSGGGGGSIPPHSAADAGKVLGVTNDGSLAWVEVSSGGNRYSNAFSNIAANVSISSEEVTT